MQKTVYMVDDTALKGIASIKMTCSCGRWMEKAFADRSARQRAENHLKRKHNGGVMKYNGHSYEVKK